MATSTESVSILRDAGFRPAPQDDSDVCCETSRPVSFDQLAGDDDALHLVGALADDEQRRIAIETLDRELLGIAVAAVDAHRLDAVLERGLGRGELRHAGLHVAALA